MFFRKTKILLAAFAFALVICIYIAYRYFSISGIVDVLSISSDGRYVISADEKEFVILWDLKNHSKRIINRKAHIWAAYFIPNTDNYVWQGQNFILHIENTNGKSLKMMPLKFLIDGIAMKRHLTYLIAGDISNGIHYCINTDCHTIFKSQSSDPREYLADKPINLTLTADEKFVIGSYFNVFMWDTLNNHFVNHYIGTAPVQTFATISPDGKYVVAGDANGGNLFVWDRATGKQIYEAADLYGGLLDRHESEDSKKWTWDTSKLIKPPIDPVTEELNTYQSLNYERELPGMQIISIKFVDTTHYLVFYSEGHYTVLFSVDSPWPIKYLDLGRDPKPATEYFERDQSMDTSPATHTLVMAKEHHAGILVYQYDPKNQTLIKVWNGR
jgi:WD40 repeat protein